MSTPALSPRPRETSHPHTTTQSRTSRPTPMSRPSAARSPVKSTPFTNYRLNDLKTPAIANTHEQKAPSPNYFGLAVDTNADKDVFASSAAQHIRGNWSPPSSNVRSTAAASPRVIPVDQNPEFEQFRRQSENNRTFSLGRFDFGSPQGSMPSPKTPVFGFGKPLPSPKSMTLPSATNEQHVERKEDGGEHDVKPRSPKRLLSTESAIVHDRPRRNSPASFLDQEGYGRTDELAKFAETRNPYPSLPPQGSSRKPTLSSSRADTLPTHVDDGKTEGPSMITPQYIVNILESAPEEVLLLDLRVSTQFAKSRIQGSLSLCIPTTLLKRASFNVQKLAETFKDEDEKEKFEMWRSSKHIVVYDASSSQMKDAATCINTLKKFTSEGWTGGSYIIRGGFQEFAASFPNWISKSSTQALSSPTSSAGGDSDLPSVAPVIGGCPMPATQNAANPFFGNIRQNMDLIGGVGQMPIKQPSAMTRSFEEELPAWLRKAANEKDNGKLVSDKFLHIEKREQKRMQKALSGQVYYGTPSSGPEAQQSVTLAGIEKGSKNRYNSIWPYEHSRVKLQGVSPGGCDYVNANHVQPAFSNKRYIATQGPLPATFNDFWNVVWQQDVRVIVMLTAEQEGGQLKAHNYWSGKQYGHLHLNALGERRAALEPSKIHRHREPSRPALGQRRSTTAHPPNKPGYFSTAEANTPPSSEQPYVIVRKFTLSNSDEPFERMREITQLQYSHWPDFGAPAHPTHLLGLIEQCNAVCRQVNGGSPSGPELPNARPIIVHCSAGCGRTGTFCTVDSVLDMLKRQRQARNARESTPMDLDPTSPNKTPRGDGIFARSMSLSMDEMTMSRRSSSSSSGNETSSGGDNDWLFKEDVDLIEKTVEDFRLQRLSMVQSLRQFVLCYESVLEYLVEQYPKSA